MYALSIFSLFIYKNLFPKGLREYILWGKFFFAFNCYFMSKITNVNGPMYVTTAQIVDTEINIGRKKS